MFQRISLIFFLLFSPLLLTGCWDRVEINDLAVVVASSFDKEGDMYRVGVQIPLVRPLGGKGQGPVFYIDSETGKTVRDAVDRLQHRMSRQMIFSHRRILIVSEEVAREGIRPGFDEVARLPDNRLTANMIISKGKAIDLLGSSPQFESLSAEAMREIVKLPFVLPVNLKDTAQALNREGVDPIIPYMEVTEPQPKGEENKKEVQLSGYAQFKEDKMVGVFKEKAAAGSHWMRSHFVTYMTTLEIQEGDSKKPITIRVTSGQSKIIPRIENGNLSYDVKVEAVGAVQESMLTEDLRFEKNQKKVSREFEKDIKESIEAFVEQAKEKQTDPAYLGVLLSRAYPKEWKENYSKQWRGMLRDIPFHIEVKASVERLGQITENITKESNRF
ncbi:Ger(x)C family spore germination protein [Ammoniphilus resinae]|uniref:Spore germination protein KC/spore germination protein n=1 Tax=Ammoniphilus resinae TaxID=861532 RepID=A0ABS4GV68_9BACL|nr:spore germination protein KC/spore germination protein [Ammoniphilus resinae]